MGFDAGNGRVLALDVEASNLNTVKIWIEPPAPPTIPSISFLPPKESHDLHRDVLSALSRKKGIYLQAHDRDAFVQLLNWYS
ncbi:MULTISPECIES: hypothetical protein [unclassified Sulfitobacter]|uniref:hypothetical protein n=1 Tax=unclassified Sulfitobacter TaxID=196795 RepID=UPI0007C270AE|nr:MULTISPECIES: hypothetical protein [unclassified Sulfitobacter]KZY02290.1 hypothetical protein A3721_19865 [Sulfitobacter sp. HI0023]KZY24212.1 hypothetical protein A3728_06110 [Sulfitobacter sp. HI0040]KZZ70296.1 hypothetical protein A3764_07955 [Sulfitobacter sp. HI0129]